MRRPQYDLGEIHEKQAGGTYLGGCHGWENTCKLGRRGTGAQGSWEKSWRHKQVERGILGGLGHTEQGLGKGPDMCPTEPGVTWGREVTPHSSHGIRGDNIPQALQITWGAAH